MDTPSPPSSSWPLVLVTWRDTHSNGSEWQSIEDVEPPRPLICHSVGWLLHENEDGVVVASTIGGHLDEEEFSGCFDVTTIDAGAVQDVLVLQEGEE